jgi:hypothetical protein
MDLMDEATMTAMIATASHHIVGDATVDETSVVDATDAVDI